MFSQIELVEANDELSDELPSFKTYDQMSFAEKISYDSKQGVSQGKRSEIQAQLEKVYGT
jgi:hypothetical protein